MKRFVSTLIGFSMLASMCNVYASDEQIPVLEKYINKIEKSLKD